MPEVRKFSRAEVLRRVKIKTALCKILIGGTAALAVFALLTMIASNLEHGSSCCE